MTLTELGSHDFSFQISLVNEQSDSNTENNHQDDSFTFSSTVDLPLLENFTELSSQWTINNPDDGIGWQVTQTEDSSNHALFLEAFDYENAFGERDVFLSPVFSLKDFSTGELSFRLAHAQYPGNSDGVIVAISADCGNSFEDMSEVYSKFGENLSTTSSSTSRYIPSDKTEWRQETINLSSFIGIENLQVAFIAVNDYGNNIYLDDIQINRTKFEDWDLEAVEVIQPSLLTCNGDISPQLRVKNAGQQTVNSFSVQLLVDGQTQEQKVVTETLLSSESTIISFNNVNLQNGSHNLAFDTSLPNSNEDENSTNNLITTTFLIDSEAEILPLRQHFSTNALESNGWKAFNLDSDLGWEIAELPDSEKKFSAHVKGYSYESVGEKDWLISPLLDFSEVSTASLFFDISYAYNDNFLDKLEVLISSDCGDHFDQLVYSKDGEALGVIKETSPWQPLLEDDWRREFLDLSAYAGQSDIRLAFVFTNAYGNNIYLDNIEFYTSNSMFPPSVENNEFIVYPNPVTNGEVTIGFNLDKKEDVSVKVFNAKGAMITHANLPGILNQFYPINLTGQGAGLYLISVQSESLNRTEKLIFSR